MAELAGPLWMHNLCRVVVVDVSDDYRFMQPPMPSEFYPVVGEVWMPSYRLDRRLATQSLVDGYSYDWHEGPGPDHEAWYVGVVQSELFPDAGDTATPSVTVAQ